MMAMPIMSDMITVTIIAPTTIITRQQKHRFGSR